MHLRCRSVHVTHFLSIPSYYSSCAYRYRYIVLIWGHSAARPASVLMSLVQAKRSYGTAFNPIIIGGKRAMGVVRHKLRARRQYVAGMDRRAGFYGRYPGAGRRAAGGVELKFHDIDWDEAVADMSAGVISNTSSLVLIGQGITESTRIGRKAIIKSIGWRGQLQLASAANAQAPHSVRLLLVMDTQCNGAAPAVSGTNGLFASADFQSFNTLVNKGRFRVLMDKTYTMNCLSAMGNGTANDTNAVNRNFTFFKRCNIPIEYSGTAAPSVITELRTNNIYGVMITSQASSTVSLDSKFRFRFADG